MKHVKTADKFRRRIKMPEMDENEYIIKQFKSPIDLEQYHVSGHVDEYTSTLHALSFFNSNPHSPTRDATVLPINLTEDYGSQPWWEIESASQRV